MIIAIIFFVVLALLIVMDSFFAYPQNNRVKNKIDAEKEDKK